MKLGSAVVTREKGDGLALGRLASVIEQISELHFQGKQVILVSSGAVAFGRQRLINQLLMGQSVRQTLRDINKHQLVINPRACAGAGQSGLMSLYEAMFAQYGIPCAQVLITKPDFTQPGSRKMLQSTLNDLLSMNIVPILNENDVVGNDSDSKYGRINLNDNDSFAAALSVELDVELLILMSNVDGIFTGPPEDPGSRLIETFNPQSMMEVKFGGKSNVGRGGMASKCAAALWAVENQVSVVIANGMSRSSTITDIVNGKKVGTFFSLETSDGPSFETQAHMCRLGGRALAALPAESRAAIINNLADLMVKELDSILNANTLDLEAANGVLSDHNIARLKLTQDKVNTLASGLKLIAESAHSTTDQVLRRMLIAEDMTLELRTVPIGVLLVIFESRPDALPQVAALSIASGNGLMLKGGKEAWHTNRVLFNLVQRAMEEFCPPTAVQLIVTREEVADLLKMNQFIDLVIPRGSSQLVKDIQDAAGSIPVMGHAEGVCHVYIDKDCDSKKARRIAIDAKCDYPAACNAMETLLIHKSHLSGGLFHKLIEDLKQNNVKIHIGPRLSMLLPVSPVPVNDFSVEYGSLDCNVEVVDSLQDAVQHIHTWGSGHTDVIVTENEKASKEFRSSVDSACVFVNCSTRFSDGYRFGLGAEVGISTGRIHARGPVGIQGLLTTKWILVGNGQTVEEFTAGDNRKQFIFKQLPIDESCEESRDVELAKTSTEADEKTDEKELVKNNVHVKKA